MGVLLDGLRDRRAFFVEQEYFHIDNGKSKKKILFDSCLETNYFCLVFTKQLKEVKHEFAKYSITFRIFENSPNFQKLASETFFPHDLLSGFQIISVKQSI